MWLGNATLQLGLSLCGGEWFQKQMEKASDPLGSGSLYVTMSVSRLVGEELYPEGHVYKSVWSIARNFGDIMLASVHFSYLPCPPTG